VWSPSEHGRRSENYADDGSAANGREHISHKILPSLPSAEVAAVIAKINAEVAEAVDVRQLAQVLGSVTYRVAAESEPKAVAAMR
jgi:hypothetical protein